MLIECPKCKKKVSTSARNCPHCALEINKPREASPDAAVPIPTPAPLPENTKLLRSIYSVVVLSLFLYMIFGYRGCACPSCGGTPIVRSLCTYCAGQGEVSVWKRAPANR